jgi:hypothetical protein
MKRKFFIKTIKGKKKHENCFGAQISDVDIDKQI